MYPSLALLLLALVVPLASGDSVSVRNSSYNEGLLGRAPTQKFSSSTLLPPQFNLLTPRLNDSGLYTFLGYRGNDAKQLAPIIMDDSGSLVWTGPEYGSVLNVQAQTYQGEPVISFYTGTEMFPGFGRGQWRILNSSYELIKTVEAQNTTANMTDPHDFQITKDDTAMVELWRLAEADLSSVGGPVKGFAWDCIIQEIDIATDELLFEWKALDHVRVEETYYTILGAGTWPGQPFDYGHLNSVQKDDAGNYLVSMRGTSTLYYIEAVTGRVLWRLGGKRSDFAMGDGATFWFQHHARMVTSGASTIFNITLFDNGANQYRQVTPQSRAITLTLDMEHMTASLLQQFVPSSHVVSSSEGSMQVLENGNVVVGWGIRPYFSEFSSNGTLLHDVHFGADATSVHSYRAFKAPWIGTPRTIPRFVRSGEEGWVSWNGATEVEDWKVLGGAGMESLREVGEERRTGFDTTLNLTNVVSAEFLAVAAFDAKGSCLGVSEILFASNSTSTGVVGQCPRRRWRKEEVRNLGALSLLVVVAGGYYYFFKHGKGVPTKGKAEYALIPR